MSSYGIIAFYRQDEAEIAASAEAICRIYQLTLKYEKLPEKSETLPALLDENTLLCLFCREGQGFLKLMKYVYALGKPALVVSSGQEGPAFHHLKIPVGYLKENREKVIWANFFQHYNPECQIELVIPMEKDEGIAMQVHDNVSFIEHIFRKSGATYIKTPRQGSFEKNLKSVFQESDDCIVFIMRPFRLFSFQLPHTIRLFRKYAHTATLIIPRDDSLYIPCH